MPLAFIDENNANAAGSLVREIDDAGRSECGGPFAAISLGDAG